MNFRRILSKNSSRSTSSSDKNVPSSEEITKLQSEIELHKQTIESLKISVESRDAAVGTLAREKEKLYVELKSVQRTNRNLHQQLVDERDIHAKEKEFLIEEIKRLSKKNSNGSNFMQDQLDEMKSNTSLKDEIKAKDEVIYNICTKYFKMRSSKYKLKKKMKKLQQQSQKICENVVMLLYENRRSLDNLLNKLVKVTSMTPACKSYIKLLKVNANLHYENIQLKVCLSLKDFNDEIDEEVSERESSQIQPITTRISKCREHSGAKAVKCKNKKIHRHRSLHSRFNKIQQEDGQAFRKIHELFSPYVRRKKCYSDPCIIDRSTE